MNSIAWIRLTANQCGNNLSQLNHSPQKKADPLKVSRTTACLIQASAFPANQDNPNGQADQVGVPGRFGSQTLWFHVPGSSWLPPRAAICWRKEFTRP
jgi:hypothetical protein